MHPLALQRIQELAKAVRPSALEVDVLQLTDTEELFIFLQAKRNDELLIVQLFHKIGCDADFLLHSFARQCEVATTEQHLDRASLQRAGDLLTPTHAGLKRYDVGEH